MSPDTGTVEVRIVELEPMWVAVARGQGRNPERRAWSTLLEWARTRGLDPYSGKHRFFGFDDPPPSPGKREYGYQQWMTVDPEVVTEAGNSVAVARFPGGRYAVTRCHGIHHITERWQRLAAWLGESEYRHRPVHELEELLTPEAILLDEYVFDLYLPLADD